MRIVLDTNVLVSALLSPFGPPAEILRLVGTGMIQVCHDLRILDEYRRVLLRPVFPFRPLEVEALLDQIEADGEPVTALPLFQRLPDPDDEAFLEVALAGEARYLVTGNLRHYPLRSLQGVRVVSPREFLKEYRRSGE